MPDGAGMTDGDIFNAAPAPVAPSPAAPVIAPPTPLGSGLAINNPLNLRPLAGGWPGQTGVSGSNFATFGNVGDGWNAADQNLQAKVTKHGLTSIQSIIGDPQNGWAPAADNNDPTAYAGKVAAALGVQPGDDISQRLLTDPNFRHQMLSSMAAVETGKPIAFGGTPAPAGLTPEQQKIWDDLQVPGAATAAGGAAAGPGAHFTVGVGQSPPTAAQEATFEKIATTQGFNPHGVTGFDGPPFALQAGGVLPQTPGAHYVDLDGVEHVVPGGLVEQAAGELAGLVQGLGPDLKAGIDKLTGGGFAAAAPGSDPVLAALGAQGSPVLPPSGAGNPAPTPQALAQASLTADAAQQRDYAIQHGGNQFAQAGRFTGQAIPATAAALAVPEVEAPAALGGFGRLAATGLTNALRGTAAAATNVGPNSAPVLQQLATGAAGGVLLPPLVSKAADVGAKLAGVASTQIPDDVRALADKAINQYGIPIRGSQIAGSVDPVAAIKDSNLITAPGSGFSANQNAQKTALTRAVSQTFGADSPKLTPPVMSQARAALGQKYDAFAAAHSIADPTATQASLSSVISDASQVMPSGDLAPLQKQVDNINELIATNGGTLPGSAYQSLVRTGAPLDRAMQAGDSNVRYYAGQIKDALDSGMKQGMTPEEIADFSNTNLQYKNLMTVKGLAAKAGIQGEISPALLPGVVNRSFDDRAFSGAGPLGDLADIVQTFMKQPPNSGTAQRLGEIAGRNWLPGILAGAAGGEAATGIGGALVHDPTLALQLGAGALAAKGAGYGINAAAGLRNGALGGRILSSAPGPIRSALDGIPNLTKPVQIPLSALAALHLPGQFPSPTAPVSANAQ